MRFNPGQTVVRRNLFPDRRIATCTAARVIEDGNRGLLLWIDGGSDAVRPATRDGRPVRQLSDMDQMRTSLLPRLGRFHTEGGALALTPPDTPYTVLWFFAGTGEFTGWYVNLEAPATRWPGGVDVFDHTLDIMIAPDGAWRWKDADTFAALTGQPHFWTLSQAAAIRSVGEQVIGLATRCAFPFDGTWCDFRPDPGWEPSRLPWWWDMPAVAAGTSPSG